MKKKTPKTSFFLHFSLPLHLPLSSNPTSIETLHLPIHHQPQDPKPNHITNSNYNNKQTLKNQQQQVFFLLSDPIQSPLPLLPRCHSHPSSHFAGCRTTILWFHSDLCLQDNEAIYATQSDSLSLVPVFLFDPQDFGKSPSGFNRIGPFWA